jgi:hypothetical protein
LRRNRHLIQRSLPKTRREKREHVDWYSAKPGEIVQIDLKQIRDRKALSREQILHLDRCRIPNYQWSALDVNSRFKLIAYSREKSWNNGLCWYLWVISWLSTHGVQSPIVFTVDNGEEFGGKSWMKVRDLRKLISSFGCRLIQNHKGRCEENAHVERSHRTDDDELYGAGYDSRSYRLESLRGTVEVFEVDHLATQNAKIRSLTSLLGSLPTWRLPTLR